MRLQLASSRWRVWLVVVGSAAAFIALALVVYWPYVANITTIYDVSEREGLGTLTAVFYLAFIVHLLASIGAATAITAWLRPARSDALVPVTVTFAILMVPLMLYLSASNQCSTGVSFPIPGFTCD